MLLRPDITIRGAPVRAGALDPGCGSPRTLPTTLRVNCRPNLATPCPLVPPMEVAIPTLQMALTILGHPVVVAATTPRVKCILKTESVEVDILQIIGEVVTGVTRTKEGEAGTDGHKGTCTLRMGTMMTPTCGAEATQMKGTLKVIGPTQELVTMTRVVVGTMVSVATGTPIRPTWAPGVVQVVATVIIHKTIWCTTSKIHVLLDLVAP